MTPLAYLKLGGLALFLAVFGFGMRSCGKQAGDAEVAQLKASHAATLQGIAEQAARAAEVSRKAFEAFREREHQQAQAFVDIATENHRKLTDVQAKAGAVVADLRAGNRRLRQQWAGCVSTSNLAAEAAAGARGFDAEADVLPAGVGRVLGIAGTCQAHVESLQAILIAERKQ